MYLILHIIFLLYLLLASLAQDFFFRINKLLSYLQDQIEYDT